MGYAVALSKSWEGLERISPAKALKVKFLADRYDIDIPNKRILSCSCNAEAKDYHAILILHYLARSIEGIPSVKGEWISFANIRGFESYEPVFKKRAVAPLVRKFGPNPEVLFETLARFDARRSSFGDAGIIVETFPGVPVMVSVWQGEEGLEPNATIAFDSSIIDIFCTEDIVVLAETVAASL